MLGGVGISSSKTFLFVRESILTWIASFHLGQKLSTLAFIHQRSVVRYHQTQQTHAQRNAQLHHQL